MVVMVAAVGGGNDDRKETTFKRIGNFYAKSICVLYISLYTQNCISK